MPRRNAPISLETLRDLLGIARALYAVLEKGWGWPDRNGGAALDR